MKSPKILSEETIINSFLEVRKVQIQFSDKTVADRFIVNTLPAVAVFLYRTDVDKIVLINQYRLASAMRNTDDSWLYEIPAGVLDKKGENEVETAKRECIEETGYNPITMRKVFSFYASPGYSTEKLTLYYATTDASHRIKAGGGLISEHEMLKTKEFELPLALKMIEEGKIMDAKTIIALQWFELQGPKILIAD